jgi:predicted amidohydrolase
LGITSGPAFELLASMPGGADHLYKRGGSAIIAPDTSYLKEPLLDEPGILYADLDSSMAIQGHLVMDSTGHYARPDVFHLDVNTRSQDGITFT